MDPVEVRELDSCFDSVAVPRPLGSRGAGGGVAGREDHPQDDAEGDRRDPAAECCSRASNHAPSPRSVVPGSEAIPGTGHLTLLVESRR